MTLQTFIAETRELCERASEGPWTHGLELEPPDNLIEGENGGGVASIVCHGNVNTVARTGQEFSHNDARFIAASRTALPKALAALEIATEALKFYLDDGLYDPELVNSDKEPFPPNHWTRTARDALAEIDRLLGDG